MAKDRILRKTGCDQNWIVKNLYSFQRKQRRDVFFMYLELYLAIFLR